LNFSKFEEAEEMPTLKNMTYRTISVELSDDRSLTLGPRESKEVHLDDLGSDDLRRRLLEEELYILPAENVALAVQPPSDS
jgi:hypothetical protein